MSDFAGYIANTGESFEGQFTSEGGVGPIGPQGLKGDKGDKPVKGVDYWTTADKTEVIQEVLEDATNSFNQTVNDRTAEFNDNADDKIDDFDENALAKTTAFNTNAATKTGTFNDNAASKTTDFNSNALSETNAFNTNAEEKTDDFNTNATSKTTAYNENASTKTGAFNSNSASKTVAFDNHVASQTEDFDDHVDEKFDELTGDFYTKTETDSLLNAKADTSDVPTKTSDLINDGATGQTGDYYAKTDSENSGLSYDDSSINQPRTLKNGVRGAALESTTNKVTAINSSSTNTQYPNAKAVYDFITGYTVPIQELTGSTIRIISLSEGIYKIPKNVMIYYAETEATIIYDNEYKYLIVHEALDEFDISKSNRKTYSVIGSKEIDYGEVYRYYVIPVGAPGFYETRGTWNVLNFKKSENTDNKVTSISDESTDTQYPSAKLLYDQLALKEAEIEALQQENEALLNQIPTGTVTDKAIHIEDSSDLSFADVQMLGEASQDTSILYYKCVGTETGDYYFVYDSTNYQFAMPTITANELLTFDTTTLKLYQGTTEITTTTASSGTLITLTATPSPDYEVPIKVVTGDNTITITGKNLLNNQNYVKTTSVKNIAITNQTIHYESSASYSTGALFYCIPVKIGSSITISYTDLATGNSSVNTQVRYSFASEKINSSSTISTNAGTAISKIDKVATITARDNYLIVTARTGQNDVVTLTGLQVEYSDTQTAFEQYTGQSITIPLGDIELVKIGDYKDRIFKAEVGNEFYDNLSSEIKATLTLGKWYKYEAIGKVILNGSEDWIIDGSGTARYFYKVNSGLGRTIPGGLCISNQYVYAGASIGSNDNKGISCSSVTSASSQVRIRYGEEQQLTDFKANLSINNLVVYGIYETPTTTEITNETLIEQLEEYRKMKTNRNITNMYTETDNEQPTQKVEYRKDLTTLFDDLREAIVAIGNT